ncbi:MAG: SxtJ family membrane protein [Proteobacteria bacterium]|nr:SxtJ family membrane protein [Pseudomonadota bacterium]
MLEPSTHKQEIEGSSDRVFGLLFAAIFAGIGLWPLFKGASFRIWSLVIAAAFLVLALALPRALSWLNRTWMKFGLLLNRIVSPLAIGVVYYLTLVPTALLMRIFGKLPLQLKYDRQAPSYWITRTPPGPDPKSMNDQF